MPQLIAVLVVIALAGFVLWLVNTLVPMDAKYKTALNGVAAVLVVLYIFSKLFGWHVLGMALVPFEMLQTGETGDR